MKAIESGFYMIKEEFFEKVNDPNLTGNKNGKENRPFYYCLEDKDKIKWLIPISSQVKNYEEKIKEIEQKKGSCDIFHIDKIYGDKAVFLIGDMFPIIEKYIKRSYMKFGKEFYLEEETKIKEIKKKSKKVLRLIEKDIPYKKHRADVKKIKTMLMEEMGQDQNPKEDRKTIKEIIIPNETIETEKTGS